VVREARAGRRSEEIEGARANLVSAQAKVDKATLDAKRARSLAERRAAAQDEVDTAETALRTAKAERDAQKEALQALERGTRPETGEHAEARASAAAAAAKLVEAGSRVEDLRAADARETTARGRLEQ